MSVPDDFDLQKMLAATSSTPTEELPRCPECGSRTIRHKTGKPAKRENSEEWNCAGCYEHFDEPDWGASDSVPDDRGRVEPQRLAPWLLLAWLALLGSVWAVSAHAGVIS